MGPNVQDVQTDWPANPLLFLGDNRFRCFHLPAASCVKILHLCFILLAFVDVAHSSQSKLCFSQKKQHQSLLPDQMMFSNGNCLLFSEPKAPINLTAEAEDTDRLKAVWLPHPESQQVGCAHLVATIRSLWGLHCETIILIWPLAN